MRLAWLGALSVLGLVSMVAPSPAAVTVRVDRSEPIGVSQLAVGVTHTRYSLDAWGDPSAVAAARQLLQASAVFQNQNLMGWGADNPEPEPGVYNWATLDARVQLMRETGATPVITLCCAPDWMKDPAWAGATDWSKLAWAPRPEHYADFAELARQVALRYPDVRYFLVWSELKGFYDSRLNTWDSDAYTRLYNAVYDALKSARPDAQVGGPYVVLDTWGDRASMSHPSDLSGPYGTFDQRPLDVIDAWLANQHGADFIALDAGTGNWDGVQVTDPFTATQKFTDAIRWVRGRTRLSIWWAEWSSTPGEYAAYSHDVQNALQAVALVRMAAAGVVVPLRWQPQGEARQAFQGDQASLWSDTRGAGGGQPFPFFFTHKVFKDDFGAGTPLYAASVSSAAIVVLASGTRTLLVNTQTSALSVDVDGTLVSLAGYEVRLV